LAGCFFTVCIRLRVLLWHHELPIAPTLTLAGAFQKRRLLKTTIQRDETVSPFSRPLHG
jgi:hypothetical protein